MDNIKKAYNLYIEQDVQNIDYMLSYFIHTSN